MERDITPVEGAVLDLLNQTRAGEEAVVREQARLYYEGLQAEAAELTIEGTFVTEVFGLRQDITDLENQAKEHIRREAINLGNFAVSMAKTKKDKQRIKEESMDQRSGSHSLIVKLLRTPPVSIPLVFPTEPEQIDGNMLSVAWEVVQDRRLMPAPGTTRFDILSVVTTQKNGQEQRRSTLNYNVSVSNESNHDLSVMTGDGEAVAGSDLFVPLGILQEARRQLVPKKAPKRRRWW